MYILICDGGYKRHVGYGSYMILEGGLDKLSEAKELSYHTFKLPKHNTNNRAEYGALIRGLRALMEVVPNVGGAQICVIMDSELVLKQLGGSYQVRNWGLREPHRKAKRLLSKFGQVKTQWQSRAFIKHFLGH